MGARQSGGHTQSQSAGGSHGTHEVERVRTITRPDGRVFAFAIYGDPDGKHTVFHCNGSGGSRLERPLHEDMLVELGVRFVSMDRPGHGLSDMQPGRRLLDFPSDVAALADHLGVEKFYVEGWSSGGAYALACAHELGPERVLRAATLSGIAPPERPSPYTGLSAKNCVWMFLSRNGSSLVYLIDRMMHRSFASKSAEEVGGMIASADSDAVDEQQLAQSPDLQRLLGSDFKEGYHQGWVGPAHDDFIVNGPWGFRLEDVQVEVDVWQGALDKNVPRIHGEYMHGRLPKSTLTILEKTAHVFLLTRWKEILEQLIRSTPIIIERV